MRRSVSCVPSKILSTKSGLSISFLSQVERGNSSLQIEGSRAIYVHLGGDFTGRALEPFHVTLPPQQMQDVVFNHPGEGFYYVIEGQVIITVDGKEFHLSKGDSIHFPSILDHT